MADEFWHWFVYFTVCLMTMIYVIITSECRYADIIFYSTQCATLLENGAIPVLYINYDKFNPIFGSRDQLRSTGLPQVFSLIVLECSHILFLNCTHFIIENSILTLLRRYFQENNALTLFGCYFETLLGNVVQQFA